MVDAAKYRRQIGDAMVSLFCDETTPLQTILQLASDAMGASPDFVVGGLVRHERELLNGETISRMMMTVPAHNLRGIPPVEGWYCDPALSVPMEHALSNAGSAIFICLYGDIENYERLIIEFVTMQSIHNPNFKGKPND